jgi:hypothetical protein
MLTPAIIQRIGHRLPQVPRTPVDQQLTNKLTRFFLAVQIEVPAVRRQEFAEQGKALLETFASVGLVPAVAAWRTDGDPIQVANYWDMGPDANVLFAAELALPDVPGFNRFNALIEKELKNIVIPICGDSSVPIDPTKLGPNNKLLADEYRYLRVVSEVSSDQLPEYIARLDGYLELFTREAGWFHGDTYLGITGDAGTVAQIWLIPTASAVEAPTLLESAPWLDPELIGHPKPRFQIYRATDQDPNLEASTD